MYRKVPAAIDRMIAVKCKVRVGFKMIDLATGEEETRIHVGQSSLWFIGVWFANTETKGGQSR